jgi:hypothetical protein
VSSSRSPLQLSPPTITEGALFIDVSSLSFSPPSITPSVRHGGSFSMDSESPCLPLQLPHPLLIRLKYPVYAGSNPITPAISSSRRPIWVVGVNESPHRCHLRRFVKAPRSQTGEGREIPERRRRDCSTNTLASDSDTIDRLVSALDVTVLWSSSEHRLAPSIRNSSSSALSLRTLPAGSNVLVKLALSPQRFSASTFNPCPPSQATPFSVLADVLRCLSGVASWSTEGSRPLTSGRSPK